MIVMSLLCICFFSNAQEKNKLNEMLNESLLLYLDWQSDLRSKAVKVGKNNYLYICVDNYPNNFSFSEEILKKDVKFMSLQNLSGQKELKKNREYRFIFTAISLEKNQISITVFGKNVFLPKKNHLHVVAADRGVFTYEYSCDKQEWKLKEKNFGGV